MDADSYGYVLQSVGNAILIILCHGDGEVRSVDGVVRCGDGDMEEETARRCFG